MKTGEQHKLQVAVGKKDKNMVLALLLEGVCANAKHTNGDAPIHLAAKLGDEEILKLLLAHGAEINALDTEGRTPILLAVRRGQVPVVQALLAAGADLTHRRYDFEGTEFNILDEASAKGRAGVVKAIIEKIGSGGDVSSLGSSGDLSSLATRALYQACVYNEPDVIDVLVDAGADIEDQSFDGISALHVAAQDGHVEATLALLRHGADKNKKDAEGSTPLQHAADPGIGKPGSGHLAVMKILIERGADVYASDTPGGMNTLHAAACANNVGAIDFLVASGVSVDTQTEWGWTPLHEASRCGNSEAIVALLGHGAETDKADDEGKTPLHVAVQFCRVLAVNLLLAAGANISVRYGEMTLSALDVACEQGPVAILKALIQHGSLEIAPDRTGFSPLHYAAGDNQGENVDVLAEAGSNVNAQTETGWTPLHCAARPCCSNSVLALLKHGADVNAQSEDGESPLHVIVRRAGKEGVAAVVDLFLRWGADETAVDAEGNTALDVIGIDLEEGDRRVEEDVERVCKMLELAPADRAWRRRGLLVWWHCSVRAMSSSGVKCVHKAPSNPGNNDGTTGNSCTEIGFTELDAWTTGAGKTEGEAGQDEFGRLPASLCSLKEEGIFREIVLFL